jgi:signal transduction histidine kinase
MAWAAVHLVVAVHNLSIHLRRQTDLEYLAFAILSLGFCVYSVGAARLTDATTYAEGTTAMRIAYLGAPVALGAFAAFAVLLDPARQDGTLLLAVVWSALGLFGNLAGLFFDPDVPAHSSPYREPEQTPIAVVWVVVACTIIAVKLFRIVRRARGDRDLALLSGGSLLLVVAAIHDQAVHFLGVPNVYVLEHATLAVSLTLSFMLLRRMSGTETELERRTAEVEVSYRELRRAQEDLIQKEQLAAVGELSAVIAHEIRNPLAILRNAASGLRRRGLESTDHRTLLTILDEESDRLGRLSNDLATYAQPLTPSSSPILLHALLDECIESVTANAAGVSVDARLGADHRPVLGDALLLRLAFDNVLENAVQAMPAGGQLTIRVDEATMGDAAAVQVEITDAGEGMNTLVKNKALDPFYTTRASGTGLGLAIVDRVVRAHGGVITLDSSYGNGTTVRITLPLSEPP